MQGILFEILNDEQKKTVIDTHELDFSYAIRNCARFRGNIIFQRGTMAAVFRVIPFIIPKIEELGLPNDVERLCTLNKGLVLVTGPTGSGKSTTLAGMIDKMNRTRELNILTIEDPIEFLHNHKMSTVRQREVGTDTASFAVALRQALRHDPDVIMIGEMRDMESVSIALTAAETGHLVLSTLHTQTAPTTISRIVDIFPNEQKEQVRQQIASSLRAVISQQLIKGTDGNRLCAVEYMTDTAAVRSLIREGKDHQLYSTISISKEAGMQTMDQALVMLFSTGKISRDNMLKYAIDTKEIQRLAQQMYGI